MKKIILLIVAILPSLSSGGTVTTKVNQVACTASANVCRVILKDAVPNSGCQYGTHLAWRPTDSLSKEFMSIALAAIATKHDVIVTASTTPDQCVMEGPLLGEIVITNP